MVFGLVTVVLGIERLASPNEDLKPITQQARWASIRRRDNKDEHGSSRIEEMKRMQAIQPTLASGQQGATIANLHVALDKFEFGGTVREGERADQRFCEGIPGSVQGVE